MRPSVLQLSQKGTCWCVGIMKQCKLCEQLKDESNFAENKMLPDGLQAACRECIKKQKETPIIQSTKVVLRPTIRCCGR